MQIAGEWFSVIVAAAVAAAYLLGGFPTGVLVSRLVHRRDIRLAGSGNPGATNIWRVFGLGWGVVVIAVDLAKGYLAAGLLPGWFLSGGGRVWAAPMGLVAVAGHVWSPYLKFRGGKGVAVAFGVALALYPTVALICLLVWVIIVALVRYASLGSLAAALAYAVGIGCLAHPSAGELGVAIVLPLLLIFTHRANIRRLIAGQELKVGRLGSAGR